MGRPRRPLLDHDRIIDAAIGLIHSRGAHGLTMRGLAGELGVQPASLYHHVSGVGGVLDGIRWRLVSQIVVDRWDDLEWGDAVDAVARAYFAALAPHPGVVPLLVAHPIADDLTSTLYGAFESKLISAGWTQRDARSVVALVEAYVLGAVLAELEPEAPPPPHRRSTDQFDFGLGVLLSGLRERHDTP